MMKIIDSLLNRVTMYRLVFYELIFLLITAGILGYFRVLSYSPVAIAGSSLFIFVVCYITNRIFAYVYQTPYNPESTWITALILALIIAPPTTLFDLHYLLLAFWASAIASASKYILAIRKKHIFNPAAFGIALSALALGLSARWWVGTLPLAPFALCGGLLIVRKIRRFDLWWAFTATFAVGTVFSALQYGSSIGASFSQSFLYTPLFFFSTVMLTEPMTSPGSRRWRLIYAFCVALLLLPFVHIGSFAFTPELALLAGNLLSYAASSKKKLILTLTEKIRLSRDVIEFVFTPERRLAFKPGQYLEWTLAHTHPDSRSIRRYFTIASSPAEPVVRLGAKFYTPASSFKKRLYALQPGDQIVAAQLAGDFTMPRDPHKKIAGIAGGIGITPFRSMIQHLLDTGERRPFTLLYLARTPEDAVYRNLLDRAERELGVTIIYVYSDMPGAKPVDATLLEQKIPDFSERVFYLSGPQGMVSAYVRLLRRMAVRRKNIRTDYFPGFA